MFVPIYDFASFLARYFKRFDKIKQFHFFRFTASTSVKYKRGNNTDDLECDLAKNTAHQLNVGDMSEVIVPAGLSAERQGYLHDEIREFISQQSRDIVTPLPTVPKKNLR